MKIIKIVTLMAFLVCGVMAQSKTKPYVIKTVASNAVGYTSYIATAYSLRGRTASGEMVRSGIIAADRKILPLGTVVHIQGMGTFVVKDTGGAIKGLRIDVWMKSGAMKFGRRKIQLRIISKPRRI